MSTLPSARPANAWRRSSTVDSPVSVTTVMPKGASASRRWNAWSAMRARNGYTNRLASRAARARSVACTWKVSDLPRPVTMTPSTDLPSARLSKMSRWAW